MKVLYSWLKEYVDIEISPKELEEKLFSVGFEVEGIDYLGDALSGVMIFPLCLPQFNEYNNLYKEFYETKFNQGYDYAYKFKSIEKIIQAAGRVIRSETDYGFCILVDPRFDSYHYKKYFPKSFKNYHTKSNLLELKSLVSNFFSKKNEI